MNPGDTFRFSIVEPHLWVVVSVGNPDVVIANFSTKNHGKALPVFGPRDCDGLSRTSFLRCDKAILLDHSSLLRLVASGHVRVSRPLPAATLKAIQLALTASPDTPNQVKTIVQAFIAPTAP